jgi:hypothetical protein
MTKQNVCSVIKSMGLTCKWDSVWQEYCINYRLYDTRRHGNDSSYHTNDNEDAIATAKIMADYK